MVLIMAVLSLIMPTHLAPTGRPSPSSSTPGATAPTAAAILQIAAAAAAAAAAAHPETDELVRGGATVAPGERVQQSRGVGRRGRGERGVV